MKKFVHTKEEVEIVTKIKPGDIIGFSFSEKNKGFIKSVKYTNLMTEKTEVALQSVQGIERGNGWGVMHLQYTWKEAVQWLIEQKVEIFVFNDSKELVKWLAEERP